MSERDKLVARLWASGPTPSILAVREAASMLERDGVRIAELEAEIARLCAEVERLTDERARGTAALRAAFGEELWRLGHPAYVVVHLREELAKLDRLWKSATNERDALLARVEAAEKAIERVLPAKAREHIDCWKVNYGLDRYDKVTAARRWAEAGGPADGPIMALATAIEWLEST